MTGAPSDIERTTKVVLRSRRTTFVAERRKAKVAAAVDARLDVLDALAARLEELLEELADAQRDGADEGRRVHEVEREGVHVQLARWGRPCGS